MISSSSELALHLSWNFSITAEICAQKPEHEAADARAKGRIAFQGRLNKVKAGKAQQKGAVLPVKLTEHIAKGPA